MPKKVSVESREDAICSRIQIIRETYGLSQEDFAKGVGIPKARLASYEQKRAPLRVDLALRICRRWIVSEEWLATGDFESFIDEAERRKITFGANFELLIFTAQRHTVDLLSEPIAHSFPPGTLFSVAYDAALALKYRELLQSHFFMPRIVFTEKPEPELALRLLNSHLEMSYRLLKLDLPEVEAWKHMRQIIKDLILKSHEAFSDNIHFKTH